MFTTAKRWTFFFSGFPVLHQKLTRGIIISLLYLSQSVSTRVLYYPYGLKKRRKKKTVEIPSSSIAIVPQTDAHTRYKRCAAHITSFFLVSIPIHAFATSRASLYLLSFHAQRRLLLQSFFFFLLFTYRGKESKLCCSPAKKIGFYYYLRTGPPPRSEDVGEQRCSG